MIYKLDDLLRLCKEKNASDLHLTSSLPPIFRIKKNLTPLKGDVLTPEEIEDLVYPIMNDEQKIISKQIGRLIFHLGFLILEDLE